MNLPVDEASIEEAEREGSFRFPAQWKQFLMRSNGFDFEVGDALIVQKGGEEVLIWCHETGTLSQTNWTTILGDENSRG